MRKIILFFGIIVFFMLTACTTKQDIYDIALEFDSITLYAEEERDLNIITKVNDEAKYIAYIATSSDNDVVIMFNNTIIAYQVGTATITFRLIDHPEVETTLNVTVVPSLEITNNQGTYNMFVDDVLTLTAVDRSDKTSLGVTWTTNRANVATVSNGNIIAQGPGTATITVISNTNARRVEVEVVVTWRTVEGVDIEDLEMDVELMDEVTLSASVLPSGANQGIVWSSDDETIATIDQEGNLKAVGVGLVTITATSLTDDTKSATITIDVKMDPMKLFSTFHVENNLRQYVTTFGYNPDQRFQWVNGSVTDYFFADMNLITDFVPVDTNIYTGQVATPAMLEIVEPMKLVRPGILHPETTNIIYHDTGNHTPGANAIMHAAYMVGSANRTARARSWHYTVDEHRIIHHIPDNEVSWQGDSFLSYGQSIGIETCVDFGSDLYTTWHRTAKLIASLFVKHDLGMDSILQHYDTSEKNCPQTLRMSGLYPLAMRLVETEFLVLKYLSDYDITFTSLNDEFVDARGRVIKAPATATRVAYTITIEGADYAESKIFHTILAGEDGTTTLTDTFDPSDFATASAFDLNVASLPKVLNINDKELLDDILVALDALTPAQLELVFSLDFLDKKLAQYFDVRVNALPSPLTLDDEAELIQLRDDYTALPAKQKAYVTSLSILEAKELELQGLKDPDFLAIVQVLAKTPRQIVKDFVLPTDGGVTWAYKSGEDTSYYDLTTGKYLKLSLDYNPITLVASLNAQSQEVVINFGLSLSETQIKVFSTRGLVPQAGGRTADGKGTYAEQEATVGFGGYAFSVGDKLFFSGQSTYIPLDKPASGNTLTMNDLRPFGSAADPLYNQALIKGVATAYAGTGALYHNISDIALTFDPSFTYGRNNAAFAGYGKVVFSPNPDGSYYVKAVWADSGDNNTTLNRMETLLPGEFLWTPHTNETTASVSGGTWFMAGTSNAVLAVNTQLHIIPYKMNFE